MNFRDMGPFENLPYTHVNIGFYPSDPPGKRILYVMRQLLIKLCKTQKGVYVHYCKSKRNLFYGRKGELLYSLESKTPF